MAFRAICFDMDGVLYEDMNFWMQVHKAYGTYEQGKALTEQYLHTDYEKLVEEVVQKLWKDKPAQPFLDLVEQRQYNPGIQKLFAAVHKKGLLTMIVSASAMHLARRVNRDFGVDVCVANDLVVKDSKIAGTFTWPIGPGFAQKQRVLEHLCKTYRLRGEQVIYVGDSDADMQAFGYVGRAIAFNSTSSALKQQANVVIDSNDLQQVIPYLE